MLEHMSLYTSFILFAIGLYGIMSQKSVLKSIISLNIMQVGVILFFVNIGYNNSSIPPIGSGINKADSMPQAFMLTAVVIGLAVASISLILYINLVRTYGSSNWDQILKIKKEMTDV